MLNLPAPVRAYQIHDGRAPSSLPSSSSSSSSSLSASSSSSSSAIVPVGVDAGGHARFDSIVTAQHRGKALVHSRFSDLVEKDAARVIVERPGGEAEAAAAARTQAAIDGVVGRKLAAARPGHVPAVAAAAAADGDGSRIIRYVPDREAPGFNPAAATRIIKMVEAQVDPLEPPKFAHKKVPGGPPDAPVPVMHSPPRKVSLADQQAWKIPACVSNWKNARGYIVPLDKRVAADGRSLLEPTINDSFAKLSEALLIAERKARVEVETRAAIQRKLALRAKEAKEAELRALAARARMERAGIADVGGMSMAIAPGAGPSSSSSYSSSSSSSSSSGLGFEGEDLDGHDTGVGASSGPGAGPRLGGFSGYGAADGDEDEGGGGGGGSASGVGGAGLPAGVEGEGDAAQPQRPQAAGESAEDYRARLDRERQRREHKRERERELRLEAAGGRRGRAARDADRDMSERIALGLPAGQGVRRGAEGGGEAMYDARLFNQSEGLGQGFGGEDGYNVYSKPWRGGAGAGAGGGGGGSGAVGDAIYRPRAAPGGAMSEAAAEAALGSLREGASKRFKADAGTDFEGVALGLGARGPPAGAVARAGPVEFERGATDDGGGFAAQASSSGSAAAADPFGLDSLLGGVGAVAGAGARRPNALDAVGKGRAGAGGGFMAAVAGSASLEGGGSGRQALAFARPEAR